MTEQMPQDDRNPATLTIPLTAARRWRAFWVCVVVAAFTLLDLSKVNVALPSIEASLGSGPTELQLIVAGYILTFGLALVPMGRLGDQRSRRALFIVGLTLFTLTSVLCALAPNSGVLLVGRLLQGVAAGIQMPQVIGLIQQLFPGKERGRAFGLFGATIGVALAFGPALGGLLIALGGPTDGWRLIFWMNLPLGVLAIALALWVLPATRRASEGRVQLDPVGVTLFGLTVLTLMWPFLFTTGSDADNPHRWWALGASALFGAVFVWWERRYTASGRSPLIPFALFRVSSFRNGTALQAAFFAATPALFLLTTLYLQQGLHLTPLAAGLVVIGFALTSAVTSWIGGNLVGRFGRALVVWGGVVQFASVGMLLVAVLYLPVDARLPVMVAAMILGGLGGGFVVSPNQTLTLADIPVRQGGLAGSVGQLVQRIGNAVGSAIVLALFYSTVSHAAADSGDVYGRAYGMSTISIAAFLGLGIAISVIDLVSRRRRATAV